VPAQVGEFESPSWSAHFGTYLACHRGRAEGKREPQRQRLLLAGVSQTERLPVEPDALFTLRFSSRTPEQGWRPRPARQPSFDPGTSSRAIDLECRSKSRRTGSAASPLISWRGSLETQSGLGLLLRPGSLAQRWRTVRMLLARVFEAARR
jgi:hypothetical protein